MMPRGPEPLHTVPLPPTIQRALAQIATELGDMPRECARDHGELCLWKNRLARRLRGVLTMRVPVSAGLGEKPKSMGLAPSPARAAAEAAFSSPSQPVAKKRGVRRILDRRGRPVRVETRQLEMQI